jgi:hypothetical protein
VRSRDLLLAKDPRPSASGGVQATYVVNQADLGRAVAAMFSLQHTR